jgi:beta-galactosidase
MKNRILLAALFITGVLQAQQIINISDDGWRLWPDVEAGWKNDKLYLPGEFPIDKLPVNAPTKGWDYLNSSNGINVTLPSTVEQHFWGTFGSKVYKEEYCYENVDAQVKNGNYKGVSWWWKKVDIPQNFTGKKVLIKIRGARLRAEVYLNNKLVGYNILSEVSFDCDISNTVIPGKSNLLAIRITNPGGEMDWMDPILMNWGDYSFHRSHGFGGLDRGITVEAHDAVFIHDSWVLNHPELNKVSGYAEIINTTTKPVKGALIQEIYDDNDSLVKSFGETPVSINANDTVILNQTLILENAKPWSVAQPNLYKLKTTFKSSQTQKSNYCDSRERIFGFRWFDAEGIGSNAILTFNHERIRILSAISWGFWGMNGIFPTSELAKKEVTSAKELGLNCIQFHRNVGKTEVLDWQDKLGLLRSMEPGGGRTALDDPKYPAGWGGKINSGYNIDTTGKTGDPKTFAHKYMEEKIIRMIRDHRSHPSLAMYVIQNEMIMNLQNPRLWHLFHRMQAEDPSRIIALHSGVEVYNQIWAKPYESKLLYDKGDGFSGWMDQHTVGGPGVWKDELYKSPEEFTHKAMSKTEIMMWGEMLGSAVPDNHEKIIDYVKNHGGKSYDLKDHQEIQDAYNTFFDKWGFHAAFKTPSDLFTDISEKSYDFWGRVIEASKLSDENDYFVISGWESTAIENHSGLVDNQRNLRCDASLLNKRVQAYKPVVKLHSLVVESGKSATMDLFLINETNQSKGKKMILTLTSPDGKQSQIGTYTVPPFEKNKFVYLTARNITSPIMTNEGKYKFSLTVDNDAVAEDEILVINTIPDKSALPKKVALIGNNNALAEQLKNEFKIDVLKFEPKKKFDLIIVSHSFKIADVAKTSAHIQNTEDDALYQSEIYGDSETMDFIIKNVPKGKTKVTLKFCETYYDQSEGRMFDVAINGEPVLENFDIFAETGKFKALDKEFTVDNKTGQIEITFPRIKFNLAKICAFKVETKRKVFAYNCGGGDYTDKSGLVWKSYLPQAPFDNEYFKIGPKESELLMSTKTLFETVKNGTPLLFLAEDEDGVIAYGKSLSNAGVLKYDTIVGKALAPWMGSWVFVRDNPVYKGLPVNCSMKSYYQVGALDANGMMINGKNVEVFAGYGRDHNRNIGAASFTATFDKGRILFHSLYGISPLSNAETEKRMQPVIAKRLLYNSLIYLNSSKK